MKSASNYRYERKFAISGMSMYEAEAFIKLHPAMFSEIYYARFVNNLYLDTPELHCYFDNVDGLRDRKKIRIRWYGDLFGTIDKPVLEIKMKKGLLGRKESYLLKPFLFDNTFQWDILIDVINNSDIPAFLKLNLRNLEPSLVNRYKRKYFQSSDKKFRVTIDSDVTFYQVNTNQNSFTRSSTEITRTIIEIIYNEEDDRVTNSISKHLPLRLTRISKYVMGKNRLGFY